MAFWFTSGDTFDNLHPTHFTGHFKHGNILHHLRMFPSLESLNKCPCQMPLLKNTVVEGGQQLESPYLSIVATLLRKIYVI